MTLVAGASLLAGCGSSFEEGISGSSAVAGSGFSPQTLTSLDQALARAFTTSAAPGMMALVAVGSSTWVGTQGTTTLGGNVPVTSGLVTRVASVTKTMTGTIVLQLIQEGRLSFDDTLSDWYPDIDGADAITIRHLGMMSSGLASYSLDDDITDEFYAHPTRVWTPEELLYAGAALEREFLPGEGFLYCNTNLVALGLIIERILNQPLAEAMQQRLFTPLGMRNSNYPSTAVLPTPHWRGYTLQSVTDGVPLDATDWSPTFTAGAGQANSTLSDLAIWARALGTGSLISTELQQARLIPNPYSTTGTRAYAFAVGTENGWIAHSGQVPGFVTQVAYLPSLDATIVVAANGDLAGEDGRPPAPKAFRELATVIAPDNVP